MLSELAGVGAIVCSMTSCESTIIGHTLNMYTIVNNSLIHGVVLKIHELFLKIVHNERMKIFGVVCKREIAMDDTLLDVAVEFTTR